MSQGFEPGDRVQLNAAGLQTYRLVRRKSPERRGTITAKPSKWVEQSWRRGQTRVHWDGLKRPEDVQEEYLKKVEDNA